MKEKVELKRAKKTTDNTDAKSERIIWKNKYEFVFCVMGYNIGLGNIWRFSYLCFKNGGGAFLVPYLLVATLCALPILFVEISIGQLTKHGVLVAFDLVPLMRGLGYAALTISGYTMIYFGIALGWCILYFVHSFTTGPFVWATCDNVWNSNSCVPIVNKVNESFHIVEGNLSTVEDAVASTTEFWNNYVLQKSSGIHDLGGFSNWKMMGCLVASWIMCYLCIAKGIRTTGKVSYLTVLLPYILMIGLFFRAVTLEGAGTGILFYITPDPGKLVSPEVWLEAGGQILYSLGVGFGVLYGFGSYNKFNFDCYKSAYLFVGICAGSSLFFGFVVFAFLGHMAHEQNKTIEDVAESGPGLVFQVLPGELALLPLAPLWSTIFFLTLIFLTIDGMFGTVEGIITALADYWPKYFGDTKKSHIWRAGLCLVFALLGMLLLFDGGIYVFELLNLYPTSGICILLVAALEIIAFGWIYGIDNFYEDVKSMIGYYPPVVFKYCIKYVSPFLCVVIFLASCVQYSPLKLGSYVYPWWANMIGWFLTLSVVLCIPIVGMKSLLETSGTWKSKWKQNTIPMQSNEIECNDEQLTSSMI